MKNKIFALCASVFGALALTGVAHTGPLVIEQTATLTPPNSSWKNFGVFGVAIDGEVALVSAERFVADSTQPDGKRHEGAALIYQKSGASWSFVAPLGPVATLSSAVRPGLAMKNGVAMVILDAARVFERAGGAWTQSSLQAALKTSIQGTDIEIDGGRIIAARIGCENDAVVIGKAGGTWVSEGTPDGHANTCGGSPPLPFLDLQGEFALVFDGMGPNYEPSTARVFKSGNFSGSPYLVFENGVGDSVFGPATALARPFLAITGSRERGTAIFQEVNGGSWGEVFTGLQPADAYMQPEVQSSLTIERLLLPGAAPIFLQRNYNDARKGYVINAFQIQPGSFYAPATHVATLQVRRDLSVGEQLDTSGRRAIVSGRTGRNEVYVFEFPTSLEQPALQAYDFEPPSVGAEWTWRPGSSFTIGSETNNHFYRQASTAGDAGAWLASSAGRNQAIQAEVTVRAFAGTDPWAGLVTRRSDDGNYYYVTLRQSGSVQLRKLVNGATTTLATKQMTVTTGRRYRLRLESMGQTHRVYVDDKLALTAFDATHAEGAAGLVMYRASADFDNVLVSASPQATIYARNFDDGQPGDWTYMAGVFTVADGVLRNTNTDGDSKLIAGALTKDCIVRARIKPTTLLTGNSWVGVAARSINPDAYVYVSLRSNNTVTFRQLVNGTSSPIAEAPYTVKPGTWYTIRLEIVADRTRVFINEKLVIALDNAPGSTQRNVATQQGAVGLVSYRAAADVDDFLAYQP